MEALDLSLEGWIDLRHVTAQCWEKHSEPQQWHEEDIEMGKLKAQGGSNGPLVWLEHRGCAGQGDTKQGG